MKSTIFSVYDSKAQAYLQPFFLPNKAVALRALTDCVNDSNHTFGKYPADYILFELGTFDESKAVFELHAAPMSIAVCSELVIPA